MDTNRHLSEARALELHAEELAVLVRNTSKDEKSPSLRLKAAREAMRRLDEKYPMLDQAHAVAERITVAGAMLELSEEELPDWLRQRVVSETSLNPWYDLTPADPEEGKRIDEAIRYKLALLRRIAELERDVAVADRGTD